MSRTMLGLSALVVASILTAAPASANDDPLTSYDQQPYSAYSPSQSTFYYRDHSYRPRAAAIPRQIVSYGGQHGPGTVVISTGNVGSITCSATGRRSVMASASAVRASLGPARGLSP